MFVGISHQPVQHSVPPEILVSVDTLLQIDLEVSKLLQKGAIVAVLPDYSQPQFISRVFSVPKKDGSLRLVVNLKPFNKFIRNTHFKMENIQMLRDLLRRDDWMVSIDLKDAYLLIPIIETHQRFLRFAWKGGVFQFQALPFGLSSAPRIFTKVLRSVGAFLRQRGWRLIIYIDDILLMHQSASTLADPFWLPCPE